MNGQPVAPSPPGAGRAGWRRPFASTALAWTLWSAGAALALLPPLQAAAQSLPGRPAAAAAPVPPSTSAAGPLLAQAPTVPSASPGGPATAVAGPVTVVLSHDSQPYDDAASGVRIELRAAGLDTRLVRLDPAGRIPAGSGLAGGRPPVIALGARAVDALAGAGRSDALACMTLEHAPAPGLSLVHGADGRLERLRRLLPDARTIGVLVAGGAGQVELADLQRAARRLGLRIVEQRIDLQRPLDAQLEPLVDRIDVLLGTYDLRIYAPAHSAGLMLFSYRNRIPLVGISDAWSRAGALFSFDWDYHDLGHQCGALAVRVLPVPPGARTVSEVPRRLTFSVSLAAARYFRLTLPSDALREASRRFD